MVHSESKHRWLGFIQKVFSFGIFSESFFGVFLFISNRFQGDLLKFELFGLHLIALQTVNQTVEWLEGIMIGHSEHSKQYSQKLGWFNYGKYDKAS